MSLQDVFQKQRMPAPDRGVVDEQRRGDLFTAPTVIERRESLDPARQPMDAPQNRRAPGRRSARSSGERSPARITTQPFRTNPAFAADYSFFRVSNAYWHIMEMRQSLCAPLKKAY